MSQKAKESEITHWNYRAIRHKDAPSWTSDIAIHEVFYEDNGDISFTEDAVGVWGSTIEELKEVLRCMLLALDKPILDSDNWKGANDEPARKTRTSG